MQTDSTELILHTALIGPHDRYGQVHSVANLFVAGSAVFPTSSQANPTLTLIALSLRLGKTLAQRLNTRHAAPVEEAFA